MSRGNKESKLKRVCASVLPPCPNLCFDMYSFYNFLVRPFDKGTTFLSSCPPVLELSHLILPRDLLIFARDLDGTLNNTNISLLMSLHHCKRFINIIILLQYYIKNMNQALPAWAGWENKTQRVIQWANAQFIMPPCPYADVTSHDKFIPINQGLFLLCDTKNEDMNVCRRSVDIFNLKCLSVPEC